MILLCYTVSFCGSSSFRLRNRNAYLSSAFSYFLRFNILLRSRFEIRYMGRYLVCLWLSLMMMMMMAMAEEKANMSSFEGLIWSSAKEEAEAEAEADVDLSIHSTDAAFSSLDSMLQWAIGHSDPATLKETAEDVKRLSPSELNKRQLEIKDLMDKLKIPTDAELIQIAIHDLNNSSLSFQHHHRALHDLLLLVESIHNANHLDKFRGLSVLIHHLNHIHPDIRKVAAWILGKATQNNPTLQNQVLALGALAKLVKMVNSDFVEEAIKALYAISALVRDNLSGQELFYAEAGDTMLQDILSNSSRDTRLQKKAVFLVSDLAETQLENAVKAEKPFFSDRFFLKSVVDLIGSTDIDLQEKALVAVKNLLFLRTTEGQVLREFCGLDVGLERMRVQLELLMEEENQREYAMDVESLRSQVELIFLEKLRKGMPVPT